MQPLLKHSHTTEHVDQRLYVVDPPALEVQPTGRFLTVAMVAAALVLMAALFFMAMQVVAQLNIVG